MGIVSYTKHSIHDKVRIYFKLSSEPLLSSSNPISTCKPLLLSPYYTDIVTAKFRRDTFFISTRWDNWEDLRHTVDISSSLLIPYLRRKIIRESLTIVVIRKSSLCFRPEVIYPNNPRNMHFLRSRLHAYKNLFAWNFNLSGS